MKTRAITGIILLAVVIALIYLGGIYRMALCGVLTIIGMWEYCQALNQKLENKMRMILLILLSLLILTTMKLNFTFGLPVLAVCLIAIFCFEVFGGKADVYRAIASVFGLVYIPLMFGYLLMFDHITKGTYYIWMVFIVAFSSDTMAYLTGRLLGKRKLCPRISPKKTVEGAIGGVVFATLFMVIYGIILKKFFAFDLALYLYAILGFVGAIASQCGDLTASMIKRKMEVKDFGKILPGHGGILDRFDSIIFTLPLVYLFACYTYGYL